MTTPIFSRRKLLVSSGVAGAAFALQPVGKVLAATVNDVVSLADYSCVADCIDGMTGTDNTAAIQAAINATPPGGVLYIPPHPSSFGAPAHGDSPGYGFLSTLTVDHPIHVFGRGMSSRLVPLQGFNPAASNFHLIQNGYYWAGIEWRDFLIGTSWFSPPFTRNGGEGILIDGGSTSKMFWKRLMIGESGNGYSLHITGIGSQHHSVEGCTIDGGIFLDSVADGQSIMHSAIGGRSAYSGIRALMVGGSLKIVGNHSVTGVGGIVVQGGSMPIIADNYCEETPGFPTNNAALLGGTNALVGLTGSSTYAARVERNILNMGVTTAPGGYPVCITNGASNTILGDNEYNIHGSLPLNHGMVYTTDPKLKTRSNTYVNPDWAEYAPGSVPPAQSVGGG